MSFLIVGGITAGGCLTIEALWHWFVVPTAACGVLIGVDAIDWARKRLDTFEPRALVGLLGVHVLFVVPLLAVSLDSWPQFIRPAADWRHSLGVLSSVHVAGLVIYRAMLARPLGIGKPKFELNVQQYRTLSHFAVLIGLLAFGAVIVRFEGPAEYLAAAADDRTAFAGSGWLLLLGESWPLMALALVLVLKREWYRDKRVALLLLLVAFVVAQFLVGGLRGSRSNSVWPILMGVGMAHVLVVPIRRRALVAGGLVLVAFMWVYGVYKTTGSEITGALTGTTSLSTLSQESSRDMTDLLLEDFGRGGVQAAIIDRQEQGSGEILAWGETYLGAGMFLLPDGLLPLAPRDKVAVGTDVLHGRGQYAAGLRASQVYGLTGEGILNFGLVGGAMAFAVLGWVIRLATRFYWRAKRNPDLLAGAIVAPAVSILAMLVLTSDLDNLLWFGVKHALPLAAVVWACRQLIAPTNPKPVLADGGEENHPGALSSHE